MQQKLRKIITLFLENLRAKKRSHCDHLKETEILLNTLIDQLPNFLVIKDENGDFLLGNRAVAEFYGTTPEMMVGKRDADFGVPLDISNAMLANVLEIMASGESSIVLEESRDANTGEIRHFRSIKKPFKDSDGKNRILVIATDITDVIESQQQVVKSERLLQEVMSIAKEGIWDWNVLTGEVVNSPQWYTTLRAPHAHKVTHVEEFAALLHPEDREKVWQKLDSLLAGRSQFYFSEHRMMRFDGSEMWVQDRGKVIQRDADGKALRVVGAFTDISEQKNHEQELEHIAHYDILTKLPNRLFWAHRLEDALKDAKRDGSFVAIIYLDLDGFKPINDTYGHDTGDILLVKIAQRVSSLLSSQETLGRLGGDEFSLILPDLASPSDALALLEKIIDSFKEPLEIDGIFHKVTASIGVTFYPQKDENADADLLLRQADLAMYYAKQSGKNRFHIFDALQDESVRTKHKMVEDVKNGLQNEEFVLHFQPKVNMQNREIIGAEALIRWQKPDGTLLPPGLFLPLIEDELISVTLGEWVLRSALSNLRTLEQNVPNMTLSINISALQLLESDFAKKLKLLLNEFTDIEPQRIELEILETSALQDINAAIEVIEECIALGVSFSLDDFGTGYSSLSYLKRLPVATLKIDQSFIKDINDDNDDLIITQGIISLAEAFGKKVIAEGVENEKLASKLIALGCPLGQGYAIARPMSSAAFVTWTQEYQNSTK